VKRLVLLALLLAAHAHAAVPTPGAPQQHAVAIVGATLHPVEGPAIANGTIVFDHGKIISVGTGPAPAGAQVVDGTGKHVYPGLIEPWTTIGLTEIDSSRPTRDFAEVEKLAPNARADQAFQPESELIPVARSNGILLVHVTPRGGVLSGQSAVMEMDGWTNADMTLKAPLGLVVNWPNMVIVRSDDPRAEVRQREARDAGLAALAKAFDDAAAWRQGGDAHDRRWESMVPVLEGKAPLFVNAEEVHQIEAAVAFAAQRKLRLVIYGGYDAPLVAELLKAHEVPVIVGGIQRLPRRKSDPYDAPFTVPARLAAAGVEVAIGNGGNSWNARNLPYQAATAQAFGLTADQALETITLAPAKILGIADRVGSLAPGKDATLFVSDGDVLEESSHVLSAWIEGRAVDMTDKQKVLEAKYREKYKRLETKTATTNP
jgi:imidazolonepropionase-like amidohydrolase